MIKWVMKQVSSTQPESFLIKKKNCCSFISINFVPELLCTAVDISGLSITLYNLLTFADKCVKQGDEYNFIFTLELSGRNFGWFDPSWTAFVAVEYSPYVTLHYQPHTMYEGDALHFKCTAEANPPEMAFRWSAHGQSNCVEILSWDCCSIVK